MQMYCVQYDLSSEFGGVCEVLDSKGMPLNNSTEQTNGLLTYWDETFERFGDLVSLGGAGRPMVVSQRLADALVSIRLPEHAYRPLHVLEDIGGREMATLIAVFFDQCTDLMSQEDKEAFLSSGIRFFESDTLSVKLLSSLLPDCDLFIGNAPLCCCTERFVDLVVSNSFTNFSFTPIDVE